MKTQAKSICDIINHINAKEEIKTIIFVGGYCANEVLLKLIKNNLTKITTSLQPSNPSLAIMEGAVLFGIQPSAINVRKAKYTIGKDIAYPWNDELYLGKGQKFFVKDYNGWYCMDCFDKYIEIGQNLKYEEEIFHTACCIDNITKIDFYKTQKKNPTFIFEKGITKIGQCIIHIDQKYTNIKDKEVKTIMKFGGTFIDVTSIHLKSGKSVKTTLIFD